MGGVIPNEDAFGRIKRSTLFFEKSYRNRGLKGSTRKRFGGGNRIFEGYLCEDLSAAASTMTGAVSATAVKLIRGTGGNLKHGPEVTIINRDTTLTVEAWTYIMWTKVNGENKIIWAACRGDVSSSCSVTEEA